MRGLVRVALENFNKLLPAFGSPYHNYFLYDYSNDADEPDFSDVAIYLARKDGTAKADYPSKAFLFNIAELNHDTYV